MLAEQTSRSHEGFLSLCRQRALRSTVDKAKHGACLVYRGQVVAAAENCYQRRSKQGP